VGEADDEPSASKYKVLAAPKVTANCVDVAAAFGVAPMSASTLVMTLVAAVCDIEFWFVLRPTGINAKRVKRDMATTPRAIVTSTREKPDERVVVTVGKPSYFRKTR
jgi:hypothetical protein